MRAVGLIDAIENVTHQKWDQRRDEFAIRPNTEDVREGLSDLSAEQRRPPGKFIFQIERDRPRVGDDAAVMLEDRDLALAAEADRCLVADGDGMHAKVGPLWCSANRVRQENVLKRQSSRPPSSHNSSMLASIEYRALYIAHSISQDRHA